MSDDSAVTVDHIDWDASPTPPLATYLRLEAADKNLFWRIGCGHHENLFDAACDELDAAQSDLRYLIRQYETLVDVHAAVVMDTPEDRELHDRAVAAFREAVAPIKARPALAPRP